jgi:flagellar basal body-associated protein FliL
MNLQKDTKLSVIVIVHRIPRIVGTTTTSTSAQFSAQMRLDVKAIEVIQEKRFQIRDEIIRLLGRDHRNEI